MRCCRSSVSRTSPVADDHPVVRRLIQPQHRRRQRLYRPQCTVADRLHARSRPQTTSPSHDLREESPTVPRRRFMASSQYVMGRPAAIHDAPHLLHAGISTLAGAHLQHRLHPAGPVHLDELVDPTEGRRVGSSAQRRADTENVDGCAVLHQFGNASLVEVAAREDPGRTQTGRVETSPDRPALGEQVAAVDAHAERSQPGRGDAIDRPLAVVGVDEKHRLIAVQVAEADERFGLRIMAHHPGVRHRSRQRQTESLAGFDVRGPAATTDERGAPRERTRLGAMRAARPELEHRAPGRRPDHARRPARHRGLEQHRRQQRGLDELSFDQRRRDAKQRLVRKDRFALGYRPDVSGEAQPREVVVEETRRGPPELWDPPQVLYLRGGETQFFQIRKRRLDSCRQQVPPAPGQAANRQFERRRSAHPGIEVAGRHRQLVEVGGQRGRHHDVMYSQMSTPSGTALLVVDVQNDFCAGGALAVPDGDRVVAPINRLLAAHAAAGAAIFATRDWHPVGSSHFRDHGGHWPVHCVAGTPRRRVSSAAAVSRRNRRGEQGTGARQ